jgi:hypothetical protein
MYSWMKCHHYRLGRANVILVNTFYELEKLPFDAVRTEVREGQRRLIPNIHSHIHRTPFQTNDKINIHSLPGITMCEDLHL